MAETLLVSQICLFFYETPWLNQNVGDMVKTQWRGLQKLVKMHTSLIVLSFIFDF